MNTLLIFLWVIAGFTCMSRWEAYIEGKHPWAKKQVGWKIQITKRYSLTAYHFWVFMMLVMFISLPLVVYGFDWKLLGVLISAASVGFIIEDYFWFVINPHFRLNNFNSKKVYWYPWFKVGSFEIPKPYVVGIVIALLSWIVLWGGIF